MYKLGEGTVLVVAHQARETLETMDVALATTARLLADAIEGLRDSGVPADKVQQLQGTLIDALSEGRRMRDSVVKAIGQMQAIQRRSNQAEVAAGCPTPWDGFARTAALPLVEGDYPAAALESALDDMPSD